MTNPTMTGMNNNLDQSRDYYCSLKFKFLKIDLESLTTYNCHAAAPHDIDFDFLKSNPGQLFNTNVNVAERQQMLINQRNASCEQNCWSAEDRGAQSPRLTQGGYNRTHSNPVTSPEILDLTIGGDCNLTCSYCCKEFSNAWRRDILNNGDYQFSLEPDNRYIGNAKDQKLVMLKQSQLKSSPQYLVLMEEIKRLAPSLKKIIITGGEPFLDNFVEDTILSLPLSSTASIQIYTGLGVSWTRFVKVLDRLKTLPNFRLIISAENTGQFLEFNRYGIKAQDFMRKVDHIKRSGINFVFHPTLTNLTVFGFVDFYTQYKDWIDHLSFAYQPRMMAVNVLDSRSKAALIKQCDALPERFRNQLVTSISAPADDIDRQNLGEFFNHYVGRRPDLNQNIYPKDFLNWMTNNHVVQ